MSRKIIIPCAGYGTRVGMSPNESKEMLQFEDEPDPIIDYSIRLALLLQAEPIVISRAEKVDLNSYLTYQHGIRPVIYKPTGEWMNTLVDNCNSFGEHNVLVLPDTRWDSPIETLEQIFFSLEDMKATMAVGMHWVSDPSKWCVKSEGHLHEKPHLKSIPPSNWAFGILGFEHYEGIRFFHDLARKKKSRVSTYTQYIKLSNFEDITRGDYQLTKYVRKDKVIE